MRLIQITELFRILNCCSGTSHLIFSFKLIYWESLKWSTKKLTLCLFIVSNYWDYLSFTPFIRIVLAKSQLKSNPENSAKNEVKASETFRKNPSHASPNPNIKRNISWSFKSYLSRQRYEQRNSQWFFIAFLIIFFKKIHYF